VGSPSLRWRGRHLKSYRGRVIALSGQEQLELDVATAAKNDEEPILPLIDNASGWSFL